MTGVPLYDELAEKAVLCGMLSSPAEVRQAVSLLASNDFYKREHQVVFRMVDTLTEGGDVVDSVVLKSKLVQGGLFERLGGMPFILSILDVPGAKANIAHHARIVRERALQRDVFYAAQRYAEHSLNGTGDEDVEKLLQTRRDLKAFQAGQEVPPKPRKIPFGEEVLPEFPIDTLPRVLADWVAHAHASLQVPVDLPAMAALSSLSAVAVGKYEVRVRGSWVEPLGLYTITTSPPGTRKSAVFSLATKSLFTYQDTRQKEEFVDLQRSNDKRRVAEDRLEAAKKRRAAAKDAAATAEAEMAYEDALADLKNAPPLRYAYRLLGDDITPERLVGHMAEQGGRFAILSAEGGLLQTVLGTRYSTSGKPSYDALLKAHAGDPIASDRKGNRGTPESLSIDRPSLTIGLSVQPEILRGLFNEESSRGVGLLARFLYAIPKDTVGTRSIRCPEIPDEVRSAYDALLWSILECQQVSELQFDREADDLLAAFEAEIEPRLADGGDLSGIRDWASKLAGATARIAALFAIGDRPSFEFSPPTTVGVGQVSRAIALAHYLIAHALAAFERSAESRDVTTAKKVLTWASRKGLTEFSLRDAFTEIRDSSIRSMEDFVPAIDALCARNLAERLPAPPSGEGRKPSPRVRLL